MKVIFVQEPGCDSKYVLPLNEVQGAIEGFFENSDPGDKYILEIAEMTQEELDALPEFEGC